MFAAEEGTIWVELQLNQLNHRLLLDTIMERMVTVDPGRSTWTTEEYGGVFVIAADVTSPAGRWIENLAEELGWDPIYKGRRV